MNRDNTWFGIALYSPHIGECSLDRWLRAVLVDSSSVVAGVKLIKLVTCSAKTHRFSKERSIDEKAISGILKDGSQGKIGFLSAYDTDIDKNTSITGKEYLKFVLNLTPGYSADIYYLKVMAHQTRYNSSEVTAYLRRLVIDFGVDYGCIIAGLNLFHVTDSLDFTASSLLEEDSILEKDNPNHPRLQFAREIPFYQNKERHFGQYIPRASWGNILSPAHVQALGGEERIQNESGAYLVEKWGGNLYVQLTESLWDYTNEQLMRLNNFFRPARFPDAPEPVYLDLSSNPYPLSSCYDDKIVT